MTNLVIVESPNKCKKIQAYLGDGWIVKASMGHVRDLPPKEMGVNMDSFKPDYVPNNKSKSADEVYLATDPDREGEAIAWHLQQALYLKNPKRVLFNEITKKAVNHAVENPTLIDYNLVHAQEGRRVLDRLVGYSVTPALSNAYGQWLTTGRVQSVAVRIVVDLELKIQAFKPTAYVEVFLLFETNKIKWQAQWVPGDLLPENQKHWTDQDLAAQIANITDVDIVSIDKQKKSRRPPAPFTTSSLQQGASVVLKISPKKCMQDAQKLFEEGLITYHRTDSPNLSNDGIHDVLAWLNNNGYADHVVNEPNTWKAKAGAQEGHEAIRPTAIIQIPDTVKSLLTPAQYQLYQLIWQRTVASQMKNAEFNVTIIQLKSSGPLRSRHMTFLAKGQQLLYPGWMTLTKQDATDESRTDEEQKLPALQAQKHLVALDGEIKNKKTKAPARYTEASLINKLEVEGIGRPSTYASIIDKIMERGYVSTEKRKLKAEALGFVVYKSLINRFQFMELSYTRDIEKQFDEIAAGKNKYFNVVSQAFGVLKNELKSFEGLKIIHGDQHTCPKCQKPLRLIQNKFWGCSGYSKDDGGCDFTVPNKNGKPGAPKTASKTKINTTYPCVCSQGYMQKRSYKNNYFWGCSTFPACNKTLPDEDGKPGIKKTNTIISTNKKSGTGKFCPKCDKGTLIKRSVKNGKNEGKSFYGCSNHYTKNIECDYFNWAN